MVTLWLRGEQKSNINIRSVFWHTLGDALASLGVIVGGLIILLTGRFLVDPIISVLISLIILYAAWSIFREGFRVLLEAAPKDIDIVSMVEDLKQIPGVKDVHDIHVWSISPELRAMNGHILIEDISTSQACRHPGQSGTGSPRTVPCGPHHIADGMPEMRYYPTFLQP